MLINYLPTIHPRPEARFIPPRREVSFIILYLFTFIPLLSSINLTLYTYKSLIPSSSLRLEQSRLFNQLFDDLQMFRCERYFLSLFLAFAARIRAEKHLRRVLILRGYQRFEGRVGLCCRRVVFHCTDKAC